MAFEVLNSILQAEKLATQTVSDAEHSASEAVKNAEGAVREQERQAAVANRALYQQLVEERRRLISKELEAQKESRREVTRAIIKKAEDRLGSAVIRIVNEVLDGHR